MLLLGSRGCGKTAMVESIISSLAKEHSNEFHVVRLNGFLHTDDRLALREMWRQLGRETNTEDDASKVSSYADTMATLLALLSHPEELFGASGNGNGVTAAKSIVILLDEFDLFVTHPRQTLLYNLFDIAQARKAPIAVIGLTTRVDVTEMLEKRVKSRFSHRYVYIPLPRTYDIFSDTCKASLDLNDDESRQITDVFCSENAVLDGNRWQTLLEGWKEYLKVFPSANRTPFRILILTFHLIANVGRQRLPISSQEDIQSDQIRERVPHQRITSYHRPQPQYSRSRPTIHPDTHTTKLQFPDTLLSRPRSSSILNICISLSKLFLPPIGLARGCHPSCGSFRSWQRRSYSPRPRTSRTFFLCSLRRICPSADHRKDFRLRLWCSCHGGSCLGSRRFPGSMGETGDLGTCHSCWLRKWHC